MTPLGNRLTRLPLRLAMRSLRQVQRVRWFFTRPRTRGAHAVAVTPEGRIVLVRLRYVSGWLFPGGGIHPGEDPAAAALRELREEIGLTHHDEIRFAFEEEAQISFRRDHSTFFIVTGARYTPAWSWEVEAITECDPASPPPGLSPRAARWLKRARSNDDRNLAL